MPPWPICAVMNNPPDGFFEETITEDLAQVPHHIIGSSSDSEEEVPAENGYELLPQESDHEVETESLAVTHDDQEMNRTPDPNLSNGTSVVLNENVVESSTLAFRDELHEVWTEDCNLNSQPMDPEHAEKVKAAMANFTLPSSAVPAWAKVVPEEEWKAELVASLKSRNGNLGCSTNSTTSSQCEGPGQCNLVNKDTAL